MAIITPIPLPTTPTPLPWRWFEFQQPPRPLRLPLSDDPHAAYLIHVDGLTIPFKFFRRPPTANKPRPVLLMMHGMGLTIATYRNVAPYLLPTHDLLLPDYSGLSLPTAPLPDHASVKAFAAAIWHLADALQIPRLSLAGNSLGGGLSLMATLMAPNRVDRLLLSNPACFPQTLPRTYRLTRIPLWGELMMGFASPERLVAGVEYIGYVDKTRFDPVLRALYTANLAPRRNRLRLMQLIRQLPNDGTDTATATHLPRLSTIHNPVLLSWGQMDPLLVAGSGDRLAAALPNVTYEIYPDLAHMPHEEAPERIGPRWSAFLNTPP